MRRPERKKVLRLKAWAPTHNWRPDKYSDLSCPDCGLRLTFAQRKAREAPTCEEEHQRRTLEIVMNS